jgi:hypothetical protein
MILGIERVIDAGQCEPGRFYLKLNYKDDPSVFQCVRIGEDDSDLMALWFSPGTDRPLGLETLLEHEPVVALPQVHIRVDAPSMFASNHTTSIRAGMFLVSNDEAFVVATTGFRGWSVLNLSTGLPVAKRWSPDWIAFSRWLLVIEDNGEEIPIASFGEFAPN